MKSKNTWCPPPHALGVHELLSLDLNNKTCKKFPAHLARSGLADDYEQVNLVVSSHLDLRSSNIRYENGALRHPEY